MLGTWFYGQIFFFELEQFEFCMKPKEIKQIEINSLRNSK